MTITDDEVRRLKDVEGMTIAQIENTAGFTTAKVKHALRRARQRRPETPVLNISDLHSGKETESFNIDVLGDRLLVMKKNVLSILDIFAKSYKFDKFMINSLGDVIDGDAIYKTHTHHTDKRAPAGRQQVNALKNIMVPIIQDIQKETGLDIEWNGVRGNHGRTTKFTHEANNYDLMFYDSLKDSFASHKKINVNVSEGFSEIVEVQGHGMLLYHGAGVRCYQSIPWYGIVQRVMRWKQSMKQDFIATCMGHFHSLGFMRWIGTDIYLNGTPVSDDDFAMENLGMDGEPSFWLFSVHPERGITWRFPISLME